MTQPTRSRRAKAPMVVVALYWILWLLLVASLYSHWHEAEPHFKLAAVIFLAFGLIAVALMSILAFHRGINRIHRDPDE